MSSDTFHKIERYDLMIDETLLWLANGCYGVGPSYGSGVSDATLPGDGMPKSERHGYGFRITPILG